VSRIEGALRRLRAQGQKGLIAYVTAGDPDLKTTGRIIKALAAVVDVIELGIPFSDPLADGPVIQRASKRALASGTNIPKVLQMVSRVAAAVDVPLALMTYYNPVLRYGPERFIRDSKQVGVDGVIVPDLPPEEGADFIEAARRAGLDPILFVAPTSTPERVRRVAKLARGFIYCVALTGTTGSDKGLSNTVQSVIGMVRRETDVPVAIGFGIADAHRARRAARYADAVIVGTALLRRIEEAEPDQVPRLAESFLGELRAALREGA